MIVFKYNSFSATCCLIFFSKKIRFPLPFLTKHRSISSKSESFSLDKNNYRYLGESECGEPLQACHIIETRSKDPYTGYEKTISHIDKAELRSWEIDFYSRRTGKLSKQLRISNYQLYLNKFWRPDQLSMLNTTTKAETILKWHEQQFNIGLADSEFRKAALERRQ